VVEETAPVAEEAPAVEETAPVAEEAPVVEERLRSLRKLRTTGRGDRSGR
jgi:hypothetical protein